MFGEKLQPSNLTVMEDTRRFHGLCLTELAELEYRAVSLVQLRYQLK